MMLKLWVNGLGVTPVMMLLPSSMILCGANLSTAGAHPHRFPLNLKRAPKSHSGF